MFLHIYDEMQINKKAQSKLCFEMAVNLVSVPRFAFIVVVRTRFYNIVKYLAFKNTFNLILYVSIGH